MKKIFKRKSVLASQQDEPDITGLISKIQKQLVSLEEKVDTLVSRSSSGPSERHSRGRHFSKPFRSFDRSYGHGRGRGDDGFRERSLTRVVCAECGKECEVPFKPSPDRPVYCRECFAKRKDSGSFRGRHDDNFGEEGRGFHQRKKPSFHRRKK